MKVLQPYPEMATHGFTVGPIAVAVLRQVSSAPWCDTALLWTDLWVFEGWCVRTRIGRSWRTPLELACGSREWAVAVCRRNRQPKPRKMAMPL
jgi:hypothetical protein